MKYAPLLLISALLGCSTAPTVKSWLDPVSSATITAQSVPLILARDEPARLSDAREFAQLAAIEVNRMGERRLYLVAIPWTSRRRIRTELEHVEDAFERIQLRMGDRSIVLDRHRGEVAELGMGESPLPLPIPGTRQFFFPIGRADLHALASSDRVQLTTQGTSPAPMHYDEWQDGRRSLGDFLARLPAEPVAVQP